MAYRAPRFSHLHAGRDIGAAAITSSHTLETDFPKDNLIDDRGGTLCQFDASNVHWFQFDLGASFVTGIDRLIIPANHNTALVRVQQDSDPGFGTSDNLTGNLAQVPGTLIDMEFASPNTKRYIRVRLNDTAQHFVSQIHLTQMVTLGAGPDISEAPDQMKPNVTRINQSTGQSPTVQNGPNQRVLEYGFPRGLSGADLTKMEAFVNAVGMTYPFYVDPASFSSPPEDDEPVLWMKFSDQPKSANAVDIPFTEARTKTYHLSMIESVD